ncbi:colicin E3/pyocin S6 family cytotoxin [Duganella sp. BuS-21]|uniref:colicin E3/pyocin S6 family cytotoxin n=1 Tax=Duganella sp. BuS-21 TaxID=2943848 RepID=UPI0035A61610
MTIAKPTPSFLDACDKLYTQRGRQIWASKDRERYYTWDALHGEIEGFDSRVRHLGAFDAISGKQTKEAVRGRKINV